MLGLCESELGQDDNALKHIDEAQTLGVTNDTQLRRVVVSKTSLKACATPLASCVRRPCKTIPLHKPWAWLPCVSAAGILLPRIPRVPLSCNGLAMLPVLPRPKI